MSDKREEVIVYPGDPEAADGTPAIAWMELGGLSVCLTRASNGGLLVGLERTADYPTDWTVDVRIVHTGTDDEELWEGTIT